MKILGINISHHASSCLIDDGIIKYFLEDEKICRIKYYSPDYCGNKISVYFLDYLLKYTSHVDYIIFSSYGRNDLEISDEKIISEYLLELKKSKVTWGNIIFDKDKHHLYHAANAFYGSGFDECVSLVLDGGGALYPKDEIILNSFHDPIDRSVDYSFNKVRTYFREIESIYKCDYNGGITKLWKHYGYDGTAFLEENNKINVARSSYIHKMNNDNNIIISNSLSCGKLFNTFSYLLGFDDGHDSGKVMGMASYAKNFQDNEWWNKIDWFYDVTDNIWITTTDLLNEIMNENKLVYRKKSNTFNSIFYEKCRIAKKLQDETLKHTLRLITKAVEISNCNNVVLSGGYFMNCLNNYQYLCKLPKNIKIYVDPLSIDSGTALGAARWLHYTLTKSNKKNPIITLYLS